MAKITEELYTLVRHSAWVVMRHPSFEFAVEERRVRTEKQRDKVVRAGGLLVFGYTVASELMDKVNFPSTVEGIIPHVEGRFAKEKIDGAQIYVP